MSNWTLEANGNDDLIDLRDVIERFEELEGERNRIADVVEESKEFNSDGLTEEEIQEAIEKRKEAGEALADWDVDNGDEFRKIKSLLNELKGCGGDEQWRGDWYPVSLIEDSYFEPAMDELLEDIGVLPKDLPCYLNVNVDYQALQMDYSSVEFNGLTFWYR